MKAPTIESATSLDEFQTVQGMAARHPDKVSVSTLRWQLRFRSESGLDKHVLRVGRRLLIHERGYIHWLTHQNRA